jgi:hypothetical protein
MLTLPDGQKWIVDGKELTRKICAARPDRVLAEPPEVTPEEFIARLLRSAYKKWPNRGFRLVPMYARTDKYGSYWELSVDNPYHAIFKGVSAASLVTPFFGAYEMPWGPIHVLYAAEDDRTGSKRTAVKTFESWDEFNEFVTFKA